MGLIPEGFAGTTQGSFFKTPSWVDKNKPPGFTPMDGEVKKNPNWPTLITGKFLIFSPNLIWLLIALGVYFIFPYNYVEAKTLAGKWVIDRLIINCALVFGFFGFWHINLYGIGLSSRPFKGDRRYRIGKVTHNMYYSFLGALQWTVWEVIFVHCYATGRLGYLSDEEAFSSWKGMINFVAWFFLVPLWRELHFYQAHRFLHHRFLYRFVHALHHRNTDIEPFAGLCMHVIEHLYYFSCVGPALYVHASPFAMLWNGIHLTLSPAASHSGWEDHWQADQFHYIHHRFFEANYGTLTFPFDMWFGTFRESLDVKSKAYKGEFVPSKENKMDAATATNQDAKSTLYGFPKWEEALYNLLCCICIPAILYCAVFQLYDVHRLAIDGVVNNAQLIAATVAAGPVLVGLVLSIYLKHPTKSLRMTIMAPFHKERVLGRGGLLALVAFMVTVVPTYHTVHMLLSPPGQAVYYSIWQ